MLHIIHFLDPLFSFQAFDKYPHKLNCFIFREMIFSFPFCNLLSCCSTFHRGSALMRWWSADLEKTTPDNFDDDSDLVVLLLYLFSKGSSLELCVFSKILFRGNWESGLDVVDWWKRLSCPFVTSSSTPPLATPKRFQIQEYNMETACIFLFINVPQV